jgi:hypothetical protein
MSRDYEDLVLEASMLWHELERLANMVHPLTDDVATRQAAVARAREVLSTVLEVRAATRRRRGKLVVRSTVP